VKAWKKTPPEIAEAFDKAVPALPTVTRRPMFGYASAFVNGNMFAGTFQDTIVVRLGEADRAALLRLKGAATFQPMGRAMKEYVVVPASIVASPKHLRGWIERGRQFAVTLPAKSPKNTQPATATSVTKPGAGKKRPVGNTATRRR
jgi:TfoX/Sxy family transcriptional regulator of competence genes